MRNSKTLVGDEAASCCISQTASQ